MSDESAERGQEQRLDYFVGRVEKPERAPVPVACT